MENSSIRKREIMAPAGNWESLEAALQAGADSVYFGVEQLNMRARATMNFSLGDLDEIVTRCTARNVRTYLTLNTIIYDHDLSIVKTVIKAAKQAGVSAVIVADHAAIQIARLVGLEVHLSTQLNITNLDTVKFYAAFAEVMVLSRELSIRQVKAIVDGIKRDKVTGPSGRLVDIEVFVHGALCMAVSGKCYLSLHTQNASANRGACVQNCRRKYTVIDQEEGHELEIDNEYIMSPKDLCTIGFLDQLVAAGVQVMKIEGRGKSADYVKTVTACYREALEAVENGTYTQEKIGQWTKKMEEVYNRGFWGGYLFGNELGEWTNASGSKATTRKIYLGKGNHYYPKSGIAEFFIEAYPLQVGDRVMIIGHKTGVVETLVESLHVNDSGAAPIARKGDTCAFPLSVPVRASDKLYKIVSADTENSL